MKTRILILLLSLALSASAQSSADTPKDINAFAQMYNEISALMRQGRFREAITKTNTALKIDPKNATLYTNMGTAYSSLNELENAEAAYRKAVSIKPDLYEANFNLAGILMNRAIRRNNSLSKAGKSDKEYNDELKQIAADADKAYPFIIKSTELKPRDQQSLNLLKFYYILKQEPAKADEIQRRIERGG